MLQIKHIIIIIILIFALICTYYWYTTRNFTIVELNDKTKWDYHDRIQAFEKKLSNWYSLGNDKFRIDHGANYYSFFERQGKMKIVVCLDNKKNVIATGIGILKYANGQNVWYICDVKVDVNYRGMGIPLKMMMNSLHNIDKSDKVYGISMNNGNEENKILSLTQKMPLIKFKNGGKLMIYSLNYDKMMVTLPIINRHLGPVNFTSLNGVKDLILQSTGKPIEILHMERGYGKNSKPIQGFTHYFCCHENSLLYKELVGNGIVTDISATIIHHNMDGVDWGFITTAQI